MMWRKVPPFFQWRKRRSMGRMSEDRKIHKDYVETASLGLAALAHFGGARILRCQVPLNGPATFGIICPEFDWKLYQDEISQEDSRLQNVGEFCKSIDYCFALIRLAEGK